MTMMTTTMPKAASRGTGMMMLLLRDVMTYVDMLSSTFSSSSSSSSSLEYTDLLTYAKETGDYFDRFVGPHMDDRLNDATHKLVIYLDDDVGRDEFWASEAAYRRMESPCRVVESRKGLMVLYDMSSFHDSVFEGKDRVKRSLGVRVKKGL